MTESFVIGPLLPGVQHRIILYIRAQVDLLRHPEIVHGLPVPVAHPGVFHIVKIVEIRCIAAYHTAVSDVSIAVRIE